MQGRVGKTLSSIVKYAGYAALGAVAVISGVALITAPGIGVGAAIGGAIEALGFYLGIGSFAVGALAAYGLQTALGLGPNLPKPDATVINYKGARPPRVIAFGRSRQFGAYTCFETAPNGVACDAYAFIQTGGFPIDGVETLYLGDKAVASAAGVVAGLADGQFGSGAVEIDFRLGAATETTYAQLVTALGADIWTDDHRGDGVVTAMTTWAPVKSKDYQQTFPNGQPGLSMVARWLRCFDWRDEAQSVDDPATWTWTENAVLHTVYWVLCYEKAERLPDKMFPSAAALQAAWDHYFAPTLRFWTAAADDADVEMDLKDGGTEARYRGCVSATLTAAKKDVRNRLLACFDGWMAPRADGALIVYSGRYYEPTVTIGPDEIVTYTWQDGIEDEGAINEIVPSYLSGPHDFQTVDAPAWDDEDDIVARGEIKATTINPDVPSNAQCRRLAKRYLSLVMAPYRGSVTTNAAGRAVRGQRYINLHIEEAGAVFYSGPAEITAVTRNLSGGGVTFAWIAADPSVDAWNAETEEGDPAPVGDTVAAEPLEQPEIVSATADFSDVGSSDGDLGSTPVSGARVLITATGMEDRPDLTWYARWRVGTSGSWSEDEYPDADPGPGVTLKTGFVPLVSNLNVEVAYSTGDGRLSPWSDPEVVDTTA
jgi:hypothetical protein